ncbi:hypothetical protein TI04_00275 [Achromatium sp. WMS2]|nr:hypothetical protein TI04_00275 [Achromatium sp. WMS2]
MLGVGYSTDAKFTDRQAWKGGRVPGTQIRFDPKLVDALLAEHQQMLAAWEHFEIACEKEKLPQVAELLKSLDEQMLQHRMQEDVKLMIFIEKRYNDNDQMATLLAMFRKERDALKKEIAEFFSKYGTLAEHPELIVELRKDVAQATHSVMNMIDAEEQNFFPLYNLELDVGRSKTTHAKESVS